MSARAGSQPPPPTPTAALANAGVSIWLDDLSRQRILSGDLQRLIAQRDVVGVTTNPTIFAAAVGGSDSYDEQIAALADGNMSAEDVVFALTTDDVARAADILRPVFDATGGVDGWVSIEVGADAAHDALATLVEAGSLSEHIDRPNVFVKIPATAEGVPAITAAIALGISVNVTLIFGLDRYRAVIDAYLTGLERAHEAGIDLRGIRSVASFFVSRVDTEVDRRLDEIGSSEAHALRSRAGIANARLAYETFTREFAGNRARRLVALGANVQRPLWASTGVKDPSLPDTMYVEELVARDVVNTMPEKTLEAVFDHGRIRGDTVTGTADESRTVLAALADLGISYDDVTATLEREGVAKFRESGVRLVATVAAALETARTERR
ncbi:transaldolase [Agromyces sp. Root81]|uniref:transaldolase n=1 Tax=Agromyces sp. Root81 TaxID=1736601 RepID=UPI0006FFB871|nr:transaldolase [Agromyces sp. Root81]KRC62591.1 transaldolase [Agromyces sp. Root81]